MYTLYKAEHFKQQVLEFALDYQKKGGAELANRFLNTLEEGLAFISDNPLACNIYHEAKSHPLLKRYEFRKWPLKHFPHNVYFRISSNVITLELIYAQAMDISHHMSDDIKT